MNASLAIAPVSFSCPGAMLVINATHGSRPYADSPACLRGLSNTDHHGPLRNESDNLPL
jgi:hypothetical protein